MVGAFALLGGPLSLAPAFAQTPPTTQAPATTTRVSGLVTDTTGAPVAGAVVTLTGAQTYSATTGPDGLYAIPAVAAGVYTATVTRTGYQTGTEQDFAVVAGTPASLNVQLAAPTLSSLRTIGSTRTIFSRATFNTSPASVSVLNTQAFIDQGQPQVKAVLNQTPGIVISLPATSGNGAAAGAITFPNIRGGLSFETATLIDGHPLSNGAFGDYVTTFLNAFTLGSVEIIKGPGANAPEVNNAIGGTVNFRTLEPTRKPSGYQTIGVDSFGGVFSNFGYSNTVLNGKLGFVLDYAINGTPGPLKDYVSPTPVSRTWLINGQPIGSTTTTSPPIPGTTQTIFNGTATLLYSGIPVSTTYSNKTELVKLRYNFSPTTSATASYLGSQTWTEQNGNHFYQYFTQFQPGATYNTVFGPQPGPVLAEDNVFAPPHEWEINNEPIFQAEVRTSWLNNTILLRGYSASINRLQYNALSNPTQPGIFSAQLYGTATVGGVPTTYTGQTATLSVPGAYFNSSEEDRVHGYSFELDHPFGDTGNVLTLAADSSRSVTGSYNVGTFVPGGAAAATVPPTSGQTFTTILVRGIWNLGPRTNVTLSNYFNQYLTHFSNNNGRTFMDEHTSHYDARLGVTYRVNPDLSLRGAAGSAIAPPYIQLYSRINTAPTLSVPSQLFATNTIANPNLVPETSFGYNLGTDYRFGPGKLTVVSADVYLTHLWNQLISTATFNNGNVTLNSCLAGQAPTSTTAPCTGPPISVPLFSTGAENLAKAKYAGIEFSIRRDPPIGLGGGIQFALQQAMPVDVPLSFYQNAGSPNLVRNLGVINGVNYYGGSQGVSNQPIPYSQGYGEIHYRTPNGGFLSFGETYYGDNNSLFVPAFFIANANARLPIGRHGLAFNVNIDNLFNTYGNSYISEYGGIFQPYVNGAVSAAGAPIFGAQLNQNTYGPRNVKLSFSYSLGR
jgi:hypothetical protein